MHSIQFIALFVLLGLTTRGPVRGISVQNTTLTTMSSTIPVNATSPPVSATSEAVNATSPTVSATSEPVNATSPAVSATSEPVNATSPTVSATSEPVNATSPAVSATSEPVNATSPAVSATSPPISATSPPINATSPAVYFSQAEIGYMPGTVVVHADLILNDESSISASDVADTLVSAAVSPSSSSSLSLNTASVVVTNPAPVPTPAPAPSPNPDQTTFAHAEMKISSYVELDKDIINLYIKKALLQMTPDAFGLLTVTVKRVIQCNGSQCGGGNGAQPTSTPSPVPTPPLYHTTETDEPTDVR